MKYRATYQGGGQAWFGGIGSRETVEHFITNNQDQPIIAVEEFGGMYDWNDDHQSVRTDAERRYGKSTVVFYSKMFRIRNRYRT